MIFKNSLRSLAFTKTLHYYNNKSHVTSTPVCQPLNITSTSPVIQMEMYHTCRQKYKIINQQQLR